ncbi:hypothetical protein, partial [Klebsiella michiganensis]|uniref:hypothetical protein n=1 Tax=Klebsiella michiganensis TaxID=1134687 RepID=UPI001F14D6E5
GISLRPRPAIGVAGKAITGDNETVANGVGPHKPARQTAITDEEIIFSGPVKNAIPVATDKEVAYTVIYQLRADITV